MFEYKVSSNTFQKLKQGKKLLKVEFIAGTKYKIAILPPTGVTMTVIDKDTGDSIKARYCYGIQLLGKKIKAIEGTYKQGTER